mgnify:FL=1
MDQTTLTLAVDSKQVNSASAALDQFAAKGKGAESAASSMEREAARLSKSAAAAQQSIRSLGVSAGQTNAALRQLPAQFTDIVTSLQAGQSPLTVFIQQGGQIKDSFGGILPAGRALLGLLTPLRLAIGGAAGAAVALAVAYEQGRRENEAFNRALILTNNAAGATAGQLANISRNVAEFGGSVSTAADAVAQLAATGRVTVANMQLVGQATVALKRSAGQDVADTVKQFEQLGRSPVEASLKLTEQYRYLTAETYRQIKALVDRNKVQEAGDLAQRVFAETAIQRTAQLEGNLGTLEKAWRAVSEGASKAWSAMLNIGRQESTQDKIRDVAEQLAAAERLVSTGTLKNGVAIDKADVERNRRRAEFLRERLNNLREVARLEERSATVQAQTQAGREEELRKAIEQDRIASQVRSAQQGSQLAQLRNDLRAQTDAYASAERTLDVMRSVGLASEEDYYEAKRALIAATSAAQVKALEAENRVLAAQQFKSDERAQQIQRDTQLANNRAEIARVQAAASAETNRLTIQETASLNAAARATQQFIDQLRLSNEARREQQRLQVESVGLSDRERQAAQTLAAENQRYAAELRKAIEDRQNNRISDAEYAKRLNALRKYHDEALAGEEQFQRDLDSARADGNRGAERAFKNYVESAKDVAGQTEQAFTNGLRGIEDAFVELAVKGKFSFKSLADSIISDLIRIQVRAQLVSSFTGLGSLFGGGGGNEDTLAAIFPQGSGRAIGGPVSPFSVHPVNERRPELLSIGGRDLLMMGSQGGTVKQAPAVQSGPTLVQNFNGYAPAEMRAQARAEGLEMARRMDRRVAWQGA